MLPLRRGGSGNWCTAGVRLFVVPVDVAGDELLPSFDGVSELWRVPVATRWRFNEDVVLERRGASIPRLACCGGTSGSGSGSGSSSSGMVSSFVVSCSASSSSSPLEESGLVCWLHVDASFELWPAYCFGAGGFG